MADLLDNAMKAAKSKVSGAATSTVSSTLKQSVPSIPGVNSAAALAANSALNPAAAASAAKDAAAAMLGDKLSKLPLDKNPELIRREVEAQVLQKQAEAQRLLLMSRDEAIEEGKKRILAYAKIPPLPYPVRLPVLNPKLLLATVLAKAMIFLKEQRQNISKNLLKRGEKTYKYPMTPPAGIPKLPKIPTIPTLPTVKLPEVPKIPTVKFPPIPKFPQF